MFRSSLARVAVSVAVLVSFTWCPVAFGEEAGETSDPAPAPAPALEPSAPPASAVYATPPARKGSYSEGYSRGELMAQQTGTAGWGWSGFGGGCLLGGLGCLGVTGAAYLVEPSSPKQVIFDEQFTSEYQIGFQQGYEKRLKRRRAGSAFLGGSIATAIFVVIYVAAVSSASSSEEEQQNIRALGVRF